MPNQNLASRAALAVVVAGAAVACGGSHGNHPAPDHAVAPPPAEAASGHEQHQGHHQQPGTGPLLHRFENASEWQSFDREDRAAWQKPEQVIELMVITPGMTVVDLGSGTGYFLPYLSRAVGERGKVLALDIEPDMVRHLEARATDEQLDNIEPRLVAVGDPALAEASVDRILIVNTWHHIPGRRAYAEKLTRALRPGGAVVVVDFTADAPSGPPAKHRLPPARVMEELATAGLAAATATESLPYQYVVVGRRK